MSLMPVLAHGLADAGADPHAGRVHVAARQGRGWPTFLSGNRAWVVLAVLIAGLLSWYRIGAKSLWYDEAYTVKWVYAPMERLVAFIRDVEPFNGLYYLWAKAWSLVQMGETWLRVPSAVLAVGTVPVVYVLGRDLAGERAGRAAALLAAVSPFLIAMAQEARSYTLAIFLVATSTLLLVRAIAQPGWLRWLAYGLVAGLAVWAHVWVAFVLVAHGLAAMVSWVHPTTRRHIVQSITGFALAASLSVPVVLLSLTGIALQPSWYPPITGEVLGRGAVLLAGGTQSAGTWGILVGIPLLVVAAVGAVAMWRRPLDGNRWRSVLAIGGLVTPAILGAAISLVRPIYTERYLAVSLPFLMVVVGAAIAAIPSARWRQVALVGVVAVSLVGVGFRYAAPKQDWRGVSDVIRSQAAPDDVVAVYRDFGKTPLDVYLHGAAAPAPFGPAVQTIPDIYDYSATDLAQDADLRRVWLVVFSGASLSDGSRDILLSGLDATHRQVERYEFNGIDVLRFDPIVESRSAGQRATDGGSDVP